MTGDTPTPEFIRRQYDFAGHLRDPGRTPPPAGIEDRRMAIYRELFYNNMEGFVASGFPVLRGLLTDEHWHEMVRDFFATHRCQTPLFAEIAQEFLTYLHSERKPAAEDPPFMLELAHYEWVELAVSVSDEDRNTPAADPNGDLMAGIPVVSPVAWNLSYRYPVHRISPEFRPQAPGDEPTHLVVYRDRADAVHFLEINTVTQRLLQLMKETPEATGLDILNVIASELQAADPEIVIRAGAELLDDLKNRNIVLGTRIA
jgi:hypothetical protein